MAIKESWKKKCQRIIINTGIKDRDFYKWLLTKKYMGGVHFDAFTWYKLYRIWHPVVHDNIDRCIIISGREGSGKSTLAIKICSALDPNFTEKNILYTPENLPNLLRTLKKGSAICMDEGNLFLFSREAMSGGNKIMVKLFALMRQLNLFCVINVPNFFTIDSYLREHRINDLFFVYKRGHFNCYTSQAIKKISLEGGKMKDVQAVNVPYEWFYQGKVSKIFPKTVDEKMYISKKTGNFEEFIDELQQTVGKPEEEKKVEVLDVTNRYNRKQASKVLAVSPGYMTQLVKEGKLDSMKIGGKIFFRKEEVDQMATFPDRRPKKYKKKPKVEEVKVQTLFAPGEPKIGGIDRKNKFGTIFG